MKILQVASLYPPHIGGIENHVSQLSYNLYKRGHDVTIYTTNIPKTKNFEKISGVKIHRFECIGQPFNNQIVPKMFLKLFESGDFDIIHAHGYLQLTTNFTAISNLKNKIPLIITSHGTVRYEDWKKYISSIYNKTLGKWTLLRAYTTIALSPTQADFLRELGIKKIKIVPNGINIINDDLNLDNSRFKREFGSNDEIIILYVGGLIPRKGINYLIDAMIEVNSNSILFIVGGALNGHPAYKEKILNQVKKKNIQNIIFTGSVDDKKLKDAYLAADIFVLPSLSEGLPTALLEAMAYKKAIIATNIPGNSDLITNNYNGILIRSQNAKELANAINLLIGDPTKRQIFGQNAYKKIEMYSWSKITSNIEQIYIAAIKEMGQKK